MQSRVKNLLNRPAVQPGEIAVASVDERFLQQSLETVEQNIAIPGFSVEDLGGALQMSRVALYKKPVAFTGKSPLDFIRTMRLKRAAQLLEINQRTVAGIAYEACFNNPEYFARAFRKGYGVLPSEYAAETERKSKGRLLGDLRI